MIRRLSVALSLFVFIWFVPACSLEKQSSGIKVLSMEREIDKSRPGFDVCDSFSLTENDAEKYFAMAEKVGDYEFNSKAIILPCKYKGKIRINEVVLNWIIMAGGAGYLYKGESVNERYLCNEKCCDAISGLC